MGAGGQTKLEFFDAVGTDFSIGEIIAGGLSFLGVAEIFPKILCGPGVGPCKLVGVHFVASRSSLAARKLASRFREADARAVGQPFYGLREGEVFAHLDELEDIAAGTAGEAFENLLVGVDVQAGAVVLVEGAEADHLEAFFL